MKVKNFKHLGTTLEEKTIGASETGLRLKYIFCINKIFLVQIIFLKN